MRDVPRGALILMIRGYQLLLSPFYAGSCRYVPSCSEYASIAIQEHGAAKGSWLAVKRISRCRPYGGSGVDAVPPRNA